MQVSLSMQKLYTQYVGARVKNSFGADRTSGIGIAQSDADISNAEKKAGREKAKSVLTEQMRQMIRDLRESEQKEKTANAAQANGLNDDQKEEEEKATPVQYNYKDVSSKIQRAKTSTSAGQAVLSAKRKVLEVRRKIASKRGDPEELQLALTHARRMEMAARKKKHHLELEEMAAATMKRDEQAEQSEEAASRIQSALCSAAEEKITEKEDAVFDERQLVMEEAAQEQVSDDLSELNEVVAEMGEETLRELEEAMELVESMEIIDPHMSREELDELKTKHRAAENKAIVKADMDYLKGMIKLQMGGAAASPNAGLCINTTV